MSKGRQKEKEEAPRHRLLKEGCQLALLSFPKAGAKVRTFKYYFQMFQEVFFLFSFPSTEIKKKTAAKKGKKEKLTAPFYRQNVKASPPPFPKADAKVDLLTTSAKYMMTFF